MSWSARYYVSTREKIYRRETQRVCSMEQRAVQLGHWDTSGSLRTPFNTRPAHPWLLLVGKKLGQPMVAPGIVRQGHGWTHIQRDKRHCGKQSHSHCGVEFKGDRRVRVGRPATTRKGIIAAIRVPLLGIVAAPGRRRPAVPRVQGTDAAAVGWQHYRGRGRRLNQISVSVRRARR